MDDQTKATKSSIRSSDADDASRKALDDVVHHPDSKMTQKAYTLDEIDRMRHALYIIHAPHNPDGMYPGDYFEKQEKRIRETVENELRTYMIGGILPGELELRADEHMAKYPEIYLRIK